MKPTMSPSSLLVLTLAAALSHQSAQAQAHASATLGNYQYTLVDLDPNDGITPSITWGQGQLTQNLWGTLSDGPDWGGAPNRIASKEDNRNYAGPIDEPHSLQYQGYELSSGPGGLSASASVQKGGEWYETALFRNDFVLSANTAVTFTAQAGVAAGVVVPDWSVIQHPSGHIMNGYFDWAPIQADMQATLYVGDSAPDFNSFPPGCRAGCLKRDSLWKFLGTYDTTELTDTSLLSVTVSNQTQNALSSQLWAGAHVAGYATAPLMMVPELSAPAQMLLGLASLGIVAGLRRRRRH